MGIYARGNLRTS